MKRLIPRISSLLVVLLLTSCFIIVPSPQALAAEDVELVGKSSGLVLVPEGSKLFNLGNLNPGDIIENTLKISNDYSKPYDLYMRAERVGEKSEGPDLLEQLQLTITYKGEVIYKGPATGKGGEGGDLTGNISLGKFNPRDSRDLVATIELDGPSTDNEFQGLTAEVKWIFTAQTTGGGKDDDKDKDKDKKPPIDVEEEPIPGGEPEPPEEPEPEPEPIDVPEEEVPTGTPPQMPKTGEGLPYPYYVVGACALLAGIGLTIKKKS